MKNKILYISIFSLAAIFLAVTAFSQETDEEKKTNKDILIFSHELHVEMDVDCESCHTIMEDTPTLSDIRLPLMDTCADCHDVEDEEQCTTCHYEDVYETYPERSYDLYFDHSSHMGQDIACMDCHQGLNEVDYGFESAKTHPSMESCFTCHNDISVASNTCESCHISTVNLIPQSHKTADFFENHKFAADMGNQECAVCHDNNFCEDCHTATVMITETNTASDFYTPYSPHKYIDNKNQQQITRVHDLNFRFTHGIDAKVKRDQCATCHQPETFCVECHSSEGGDFALGGVVPYSHTLNNFLTVGVGTGGGEHAILAKRDIESCAGCHDTQGGDPTCILCHIDTDGIKGTNPKTHANSFMMDAEGDWHSDDGSLCFNCHVNTRTAGIGFCGYCHSSN